MLSRELSREEFIKVSLETNLFFQRIMKEHLFLIEINLHPAGPDHISIARHLKIRFEELLKETVHYSNGVISEDAIRTNEIVTPYTLIAEEITSKLTGAEINTDITKAELELKSNPNYSYREWYNIVSHINSKSLSLLEEVILFKKTLLTLVSECKVFISIYHEMLAHLIHEAEYYKEILINLQNETLPEKTLCEELNFWNHIMGEHAQFVDGMLDPKEIELKEAAEITAERFEKLVKDCISTAENQILGASIRSTEDIRDFKADATIGILKCEIKSIIPPILADHVLREANHYLRILNMLTR